jgi:hypothetical protein
VGWGDWGFRTCDVPSSTCPCWQADWLQQTGRAVKVGGMALASAAAVAAERLAASESEPYERIGCCGPTRPQAARAACLGVWGLWGAGLSFDVLRVAVPSSLLLVYVWCCDRNRVYPSFIYPESGDGECGRPPRTVFGGPGLGGGAAGPAHPFDLRKSKSSPIHVVSGDHTATHADRPASRPSVPHEGIERRDSPCSRGQPRHLRTTTRTLVACAAAAAFVWDGRTGRDGMGRARRSLRQASRSLFASKHKWPGSTGCRIFRPQFRGPSRAGAAVPGPFTASPSHVFLFACFAAKHLWQPEAGAWTTRTCIRD